MPEEALGFLPLQAQPALAIGPEHLLGHWSVLVQQMCPSLEDLLDHFELPQLELL